ncbi:MAG: hypothetical protein JWM99_177, partial [Verrucomicrobiales bacterium]|nr:hypothetical protein [Verrucomicrobiales bacterium]
MGIVVYIGHGSLLLIPWRIDRKPKIHSQNYDLRAFLRARPFSLPNQE